MDPVTHLASGALLAQAARGRFFPKARGFVPACMLVAWLPDIDNLAVGEPGQYLLHHRGLTHSLVGGAGLALLAGLTARLCSREYRLGRSCLLAYGLVLLHIFLDLVTSYGTQVLLPFSNARLSLDAVFIIDPFWTLAMLLFVLFSVKLPRKRTYFVLMGLAWILVYPLSNLGLGQSLENLYAARLAREQVRFESVRFLPDAFTPYFWKVVVQTPESYTVTTVTALDFTPRHPAETRPRADRALLRRLGETAPVFATFEWFSRFPSQERSIEGGRERIRFSDVRSLNTNPVMRALFGPERTGFALTAILDHEGRLAEYLLQRRDSVRSFTPQAP